ncbi:MAG: ATP synthase F1 subunit delta [Atopostipes sp.]|nr:ATP synthase F1 subunit delta [Atopostipes sp.]
MRLTKQYAYAFLASLEKEEKLPMYDELKKISEILDGHEDYISILEFIPEEMEHFNEILAEDFHPLAVNLIHVLAQDGLLGRLDTVIEDYRFGLVEEEILTEVSVSSAKPLSTKFKEKLKELIQESWTTDFMLNFTVDSDLIGGVRLEVNNAVIDTTFRSRINQILREV